jgi:SAM-dependent methyltransferase
MAGVGAFDHIVDVAPGEGSPKDRSRFERLLRDIASIAGIDVLQDVLIVGGSFRDAHVLYRAGFRRITLSNIEPLIDAEDEPMDGAEVTLLYADLENLAIPDASYDVVVAHEVLHHCRSPHRALLEMLRVSRKHVVMMEPNDSAAMRLLVRMRFSSPYELPAVIANDYKKGGVQNTSVPNYIYRWDARNLYQATAACLPEREFLLLVQQYWDFNVDTRELARRSGTRIGFLAKIFSPQLLLLALRTFQALANSLPWTRRQGNAFFACVTKTSALKPWIVRNGEAFAFNRAYEKD